RRNVKKCLTRRREYVRIKFGHRRVAAGGGSLTSEDGVVRRGRDDGDGCEEGIASGSTTVHPMPAEAAGAVTIGSRHVAPCRAKRRPVSAAGRYAASRFVSRHTAE